MRLALTGLLLVLIFLKCFSQQKTEQVLDGLASVVFPDSVHLKKVSSVKLYMSTWDNSVYIAQASPFRKTIKDYILGRSLKEIYDEYLKGFLKGANGKLQSKRATALDGLECTQFNYITVLNNHSYFNSTYLVYLNNYMLNFTLMSTDSKKREDKNAQAFFNSFKLKINERDARQHNAAELGHYTGYIVSKVLIVSIVGGLIILIIKKLTS